MVGFPVYQSMATQWFSLLHFHIFSVYFVWKHSTKEAVLDLERSPELLALKESNIRNIFNNHSDVRNMAYRRLNQSMTCDFQQCGILTSVDSDEPVQPPFKLRNSK